MRKIITTLFFFTALQLHTVAANAQVCWMSGTNITGEGTGIHASEIPVLALQDIMVDTIITSGGSGGGQSNRWGLEDLKFKIPFNKSSVAFLNAFRTGLNIASITVKFWYQKPDASFAAWTTIALQNVRFTSYKILAPECSGSNCNIPFLEIALNWRIMTVSDDFGNISVLDKQILGIQ